MSTIEMMTVQQLHAEARRRGKKKYTRLSKAKLIEMLSFSSAPQCAPQCAPQFAPQSPAVGNPLNICPSMATHSKHSKHRKHSMTADTREKTLERSLPS